METAAEMLTRGVVLDLPVAAGEQLVGRTSRTDLLAALRSVATTRASSRLRGVRGPHGHTGSVDQQDTVDRHVCRLFRTRVLLRP